MKLPIALLLAVVACTPGPVVWPGPDSSDAASAADASPELDSSPIADAAPAPSDASDDCGRAEATLVRLACKDDRGQPLAVNKHGVPFASTCRDLALHRVDVKPSCIARATSCAAALGCSL